MCSGSALVAPRAHVFLFYFDMVSHCMWLVGGWVAQFVPTGNSR